MEIPVGVSDPELQQVGSDGSALRVTRTDSPRRLVLAGDIDEWTYADLLAALADAAAGPGEIHINLAGVQYCDLAGLRAILRLGSASSQQLDPSGRRLVLAELPAHLKTVLRILGWDCAPGLVIINDHHDPMPQQPSAQASGSQVRDIDPASAVPQTPLMPSA
jgi:ABC-type transporter Mla MlaB component